MTDQKFREIIYQPYCDIWKIIKLLQHAYKHLEDPERSKVNDEIWETYKREGERLKKAYPDNPFVEELHNLLFKVDDIIARMNQEELTDD